MTILLLIWAVFVLIYIGYNAYGLVQINSKRFQCDAAGIAIAVYISLVIIVLLISLLFISQLDWHWSIGSIIKFK